MFVSNGAKGITFFASYLLKEEFSLDDIINRILNIDKEAEGRIVKAEQDKASILKGAKLKEIKLKDDCIFRADNRIDKVEKTEKANADVEIAKYNQQTEEKNKKFDELFAENGKQWKDEIVNRIVGE